MKNVFLLVTILISVTAYSQDQKISFDNFSNEGNSKIIPKPQKVDLDYDGLTSYAGKMFLKKEYRTAINLYVQAFKQNKDSGKVSDRYRLASSYAILGVSDSAFIQLYRIAEKGNFSETEFISDDYNFLKLHSDVKWGKLIAIIKENERKKEIDNN